MELQCLTVFSAIFTLAFFEKGKLAKSWPTQYWPIAGLHGCYDQQTAFIHHVAIYRVNTLYATKNNRDKSF